MIPHGTPEWRAARLGKVTASRIADLRARTKTGWGASRRNYMAELLVERLTGRPYEGYASAEMRWGAEVEAQAADAYAFYTGRAIKSGGYLDHPTIEMAGASPDRLVDSGGLAEFKCPNTATHLDTLLDAGIPGNYAQQMQWQMAVTGLAWCDWVSFDPRLPEHLRLFVRRLDRDDAVIAQIERDVRQFLKELDSKIWMLNNLEAA